jgi:CheY-like chemotaxis protein
VGQSKIGRKKTSKILVVEDNDDDLYLIKKALDSLDLKHELHCVKNGIEMIDYLNGIPSGVERPSLIFLDLNMPMKNGREILAEIKGNPIFKRIPIIVLTTSKSEKDIIHSYDNGAKSYIVKPVNFKVFAEQLKLTCKYWLEVVKLAPLNGS